MGNGLQFPAASTNQNMSISVYYEGVLEFPNFNRCRKASNNSCAKSTRSVTHKYLVYTFQAINSSHFSKLDLTGASDFGFRLSGNELMKLEARCMMHNLKSVCPS